MFVRLWQVLLTALVVSAATPTSRRNRRAEPPVQFVSTKDGKFTVNNA